MSGLTRQERYRMIMGFSMISGGLALDMVFFALIGTLAIATSILVIVGIVMIIASPVLWLFHRSARIVYGALVAGLATVVGSVGGSLIITIVLAAVH